MTHFESIDELLAQDELGTSGWHLIGQSRINAFADVTGDHQWIHVDPDRARREGPFSGTVAHGALTLSLCTAFLTEIVQIRTVTHVVNSGFDRVRFHAPVPVDSRLRGTAKLVTSRRMGGGARVVIRITAEVEGATRPACVADQILAFYG